MSITIANYDKRVSLFSGVSIFERSEKVLSRKYSICFPYTGGNPATNANMSPGSVIFCSVSFTGPGSLIIRPMLILLAKRNWPKKISHILLDRPNINKCSEQLLTAIPNIIFLLFIFSISFLRFQYYYFWRYIYYVMDTSILHYLELFT